MAATRLIPPRIRALIPRDLTRVFVVLSSLILLVVLLAWFGVMRWIQSDFLAARIEALKRSGCIEDNSKIVYSTFPLTSGRQMRVFNCPRGLVEQVPKLVD